MTKFTDLHIYRAAHRMKNFELANELGVSAFRLAGLLYPERYSVRLDDGLVSRIAKLLNQTPEYVRRQYQRAA